MIEKSLTPAEFAAIALALGCLDDMTIDRAYMAALIGDLMPPQPSTAIRYVETALMNAGWYQRVTPTH